jgi:nucleoid DNA-binding protein
MAKAKKSVKKSASKAARKPVRKTTPKSPQSIKTVLTKSALVAHLAEAAQVAGKDVRALLAALEETIRVSISKKGPRTFMLPGLLKITVASVPAKKARKGINPFTGQETIFKAKPATVKVKVRPMKKLKDAAKA